MTVAAVPCNRPLPLSQSEAVLWSICEGGDVPHNITESPFHPFGAGIVRVFPLQFYFGGEPSLEPDVSQVIWTLNRSEPSPNGWVFCPHCRERTEASEKEQRRRLVIFARATSPGRRTSAFPPGPVELDDVTVLGPPGVQAKTILTLSI